MKISPIDPAGALIVTAMLDTASQARFDDERRLYFPPSRNFLDAHVTLFHALPGGEQETVARTLDAVCNLQSPVQPPVQFKTCGLRHLGRGVAYALHMPELVAIRASLAKTWSAWLTPQDRQGFRPHITVQNKVEPAEAKALFSDLESKYVCWQGEVTGLALWRYQSGPWAKIGKVWFKRRATPECGGVGSCIPG